jgi:hypothetical protein
MQAHRWTGRGIAAGLAAAWLATAAGGAEILAFDAAAHYTTTGWQTGANQGQGWGGDWTVTGTAQASGFLATAAANPRLRLGSQAFGLWADNGLLAEAIRPFAAPLPAGGVFRVRFQNLNVSSSRSQSVGLALRDAAGNILIQFYYNGGQANYRVSDAAPGRATSLPFTDQGVDVEILLLSEMRYRLVANSLVVEGDYTAPPAQMRFWNWSGWSGGENDLFFDEPSLLLPAAPGTALMLPEAPQECAEPTIFYDARGGPLAAAEEVVLYLGRNGWLHPRDLPMEPRGDGLWQAVVPLRRRTVSLEWAFHDNGAGAARQWDNNQRRDWRTAVAPCDAAGALEIVEPSWHGSLGHRSEVEIRGRAVGLEGQLHWRNETTGQAGWIPATPAWTVPGLALAEGTNEFRITGTTRAQSPNHGARDCATNAVYRQNGWQWRQNAGQGWGEWALTVEGEGGHFIGTDASTNLSSHPYAWGLHSRNGGQGMAVRRLDQPLAVGETVRMKFENNHVQTGGSVGISLRDGRDERLFSFLFIGGRANYLINDDAVERDTGLPWRAGGLELEFELTSPTTYRFTAAGQVWTGTLNAPADGRIRILRFWSFDAGTGSGHNVFLADLSITGAPRAGRELAARRTLVREPGPRFEVEMPGPGGGIRLTVPHPDPDHEYDVYITEDLVGGGWRPAGLGRRGNAGAPVFELAAPAPARFYATAMRPVRAWAIDNPYAGVNWSEFEPHKAALHMHTMMSDGGGRPHEVIDRYAALGYTIVSITDHDTQGPYNNLTHPDRARTTWPWEGFGRVPEALGLLAIEGNEISKRVHHGSYFNDFGAPDLQAEQDSLDAIVARGGLAVMFHPGRYTSGEDPITRDVAWYVGMFRSHPHLVGIEVYNQIDRFPGDRATWDAVQTQLIDERLVWGFSNDDMHSMTSQLGYNYNILLLPELSAEWMRRALTEGMFFYVHRPQAHNGPPPPVVRAIRVNEADGVIALEAAGHDRIEWISEGGAVHTGDEIRLGELANLGRYVRAVVHGAEDGTVVGTQPFRIARRTP